MKNIDNILLYVRGHSMRNPVLMAAIVRDLVDLAQQPFPKPQAPEVVTKLNTALSCIETGRHIDASNVITQIIGKWK